MVSLAMDVLDLTVYSSCSGYCPGHLLSQGLVTKKATGLDPAWTYVREKLAGTVCTGQQREVSLNRIFEEGVTCRLLTMWVSQCKVKPLTNCCIVVAFLCFLVKPKCLVGVICFFLLLVLLRIWIKLIKVHKLLQESLVNNSTFWTQSICYKLHPICFEAAILLWPGAWFVFNTKPRSIDGILGGLFDDLELAMEWFTCSQCVLAAWAVVVCICRHRLQKLGHVFQWHSITEAREGISAYVFI